MATSRVPASDLGSLIIGSSTDGQITAQTMWTTPETGVRSLSLRMMRSLRRSSVSSPNRGAHQAASRTIAR